ncbi:uncharacterized protein PSANT_00502 [Moesziomyces antarcticus]|uniref:Uncharacterized protein n=1 Tax=Pseudozyma antarctica TaxID=84753 RepID=A0A5C3FHG1_PSEA2|nr:uncharacterized protein PSANT_00502 [Moesziomyces antarcticus]
MPSALDRHRFSCSATKGLRRRLRLTPECHNHASAPLYEQRSGRLSYVSPFVGPRRLRAEIPTRSSECTTNDLHLQVDHGSDERRAAMPALC